MGASDFSLAIPAKLFVRSVIEIDGTEPDELLGLLVEGVLEELLLHAARARHAATGSAATAPFPALINHLVS
jgi:hypothetical protein